MQNKIFSKLSSALLTTPTEKRKLGTENVRHAAQILRDYKNGKASLESRIVEDELWWKLRHWDVMRSGKEQNRPEPVSAWLFNSLTSKHADAMVKVVRNAEFELEAEARMDKVRKNAALGAGELGSEIVEGEAKGDQRGD